MFHQHVQICHKKVQFWQLIWIFVTLFGSSIPTPAESEIDRLPSLIFYFLLLRFETLETLDQRILEKILAKRRKDKKRVFIGTSGQFCILTRGGTLLWDNRRLIGRSLIVLARQVQNNRN